MLHAGAVVFENLRHAPRAIPIASAILVGLLLLDAVFVIARTSSPQGVMADVLALVPSQVGQPAAATTQPPAKLKRRVLPTASPIPALATADAQMAQLMLQPPTDACPNPIGQLVTETVQSKVVGGPMPVNVYLPPCYRPGQYKYPTLYLIQGNNHELGGWVDIGITRIANMQMSLGMIPPFIIVMPANGQYGKNPYTWSWKGPTSYEGFLVNELVPFVDNKFSTWRERDGRAIGGISRGGYWSIQVAFANPDKFSVMGAHSPSITDKLIGAGPNFTMLSMAKTITDVSKIRIWIDAGSSADWAVKDAKKFAADLDHINAPYQISFGQGAHDDPTWAARVTDYLAFYSSQWPRLAKANNTVIGSAKP